jgi:hypothetical protein
VVNKSLTTYVGRGYIGQIIPPFPSSSKEEEEVHREVERRKENKTKHEVDKMIGNIHERLEGSGKAPMDPKVAFKEVLNNLFFNQQAMTQSLAHMDDRLATESTLGTQAPHATKGNSGAGNEPYSPTLTYTSLSRIPRPLFPSFQRASSTTSQQLIAQR